MIVKGPVKTLIFEKKSPMHGANNQAYLRFRDLLPQLDIHELEAAMREIAKLLVKYKKAYNDKGTLSPKGIENRNTSEADILTQLAKPMRKRLDIEELKKEQRFKSIDKKEFFKKIEELKVDEPIERLLAMA